MKRMLMVVLAAQALWTWGATAAEPELTDEERDFFLLGNAIHTLLHEAGHLVVHQFDLPILGQEEDAADNFATWALRDGWDKDWANDALWVTAQVGFLYSDADGLPEGDSLFFEQHDLDAQRAARVMCHLLLDDEETFGPLIEDWVLEEGDEAACFESYDFSQENWQRVLAPRILTDEPSQTVSFEYQPAAEDVAFYAKFLADNDVLEDVAGYLNETFQLWEGTVIEAASCEEPNAFYNLETLRITLCYELLADIDGLLE